MLTRTRCDEALKALETQDYFVAIGALSGLDEQISAVRLRAAHSDRIQNPTRPSITKINATRRNE